MKEYYTKIFSGKVRTWVSIRRGKRVGGNKILPLIIRKSKYNTLMLWLLIIKGGEKWDSEH